MTETTRAHAAPTLAERGSRALPDQLVERPPERRGPVRLLVISVSGGAVLLAGLLYLLASPFIAMASGLADIVIDIRDTAVRPRPFVGARHGMPFLDR